MPGNQGALSGLGQWRRTAAQVVIVATAYFIGARLGLHLAYANRNITAVWPPTGISVAALLLFGPWMTPGIVAGAFVANLTNGAGWHTSALITVGNTLAPLVAMVLVNLLSRGDRTMDSFGNVLVVLVAGGPVAMTISATLGTASLAVTHQIPWSAYGTNWPTWWVGDAMGVVIFAPMILVLASDWWHDVHYDGRLVAEAAIEMGVVLTVALATFVHHVPAAYTLFPLAALMAVRIGRIGAVAVLAVVSMVSVIETVNGHGPFSGLAATTSLVELQAYNGALALTSLVLAAVAVQARRADDELRRHVAGLEEVLRLERLSAFGEMTSVVSHELRNPLAALTNAAFLLRGRMGDGIDQDSDKYLQMIVRSAQRASSLAEDLLAYRRMRPPQRSPHDLRAMVDEALELAPPPVGVHVRSALPELTIYADGRQVIQILTNVITNAYQSMADGGTLELRAQQHNGSVVLSAIDDGHGFDPAMSGRMFEPFFTTKETGSGLGLAIVRQLAEAHGGSVSIDNRPGGGAVVSVRLPST